MARLVYILVMLPFSIGLGLKVSEIAGKLGHNTIFFFILGGGIMYVFPPLGIVAFYVSSLCSVKEKPAEEQHTLSGDIYKLSGGKIKIGNNGVNGLGFAKEKESTPKLIRKYKAEYNSGKITKEEYERYKSEALKRNNTTTEYNEALPETYTDEEILRAESEDGKIF